MKLRNYIFIFVTAFAGSFFLASCLNEENRIPPNCYDGILNNGEVNIDCGGANCTECDHCTNGVWDIDRGETWRDCGGECPVCNQCANGILDGDEQAVDCGGTNPACSTCDLLCDDGLLNGYEDDVDCENATDVEQGGCPFCPTCIDNICNGDEQGIDCGGPDCEPCCATGNCRDGVKNSNEFYIDCGGKICADCVDTLHWKIGGKTYASPSIAFATGTNVTDVGGVLTFSSFPAFELQNNQPNPVPTSATLSLMITKPITAPTWTQMLNNQIVFPSNNYDIADYTISWTDDMGEVFTTSDTGGSGKFTMQYFGNAVVPNDPLDGCHKPAGTYVFYRGIFSGTLSSASLGTTVNCTNGTFQVTFYTP
jgi:hypothetical protein